MCFGYEIISMAKRNKKGYLRIPLRIWKIIGQDVLTFFEEKYMVPGDKLLILIGYKYNYRKFLSIITSEDSGMKKAGIPYLSNDHDQFDNVSIQPVSINLVISKLFVSVNDVEYHNKYR